MKRAIVFIVILCAACSDPKPGKAAFSKNEQIGLVTERGSAMRIEPYVYSSKVGELAKGAGADVLMFNWPSWISMTEFPVLNARAASERLITLLQKIYG